MTFFEASDGKPVPESMEAGRFDDMKSFHPELWPFPQFYLTSRNNAVRYIEWGCLATPTAELSQFTHEPLDVSFERRPLYEAPSLLSTIVNLNYPKSRWKKGTYGISEEEVRLQTLMLTPKTPAIRAAFLDVFSRLESDPKAEPLIRAYRKARTPTLKVTTGDLRTHITHEYTIHPLFDGISHSEPRYAARRGSASFFLEKQSINAFPLPDLLKNYTKAARRLIPLFETNLQAILQRDLNPVEYIVVEYGACLFYRQKETDPKWKDADDEYAPRAWYEATTDRASPSSRNYDVRFSQLHWSAAILDYVVNLQTVYDSLKKQGIPTCIPTIGPTIKAKKMMHVHRSLESLANAAKKPDPVSITLPADKSVIFISSNNGGKTFTMEMIGANAMESMQGRKALASSFESPEFDAIMAIPAELPQETGKSMYTAQLARLVQAIQEIQAIQSVKPDARILLLADELFAGTDEHDSAALYKATIEWMNAHHVTLIGATNNELVFDTDIAQFLTMQRHKPVAVLHSSDIVHIREGIPMLAKAGLPEEVVRRASELADVPMPEMKPVKVSEFTDRRNAVTMGLIELSGEIASAGRNFQMWDQVDRHGPFFRQSEVLVSLFTSAPDAPIKQEYRAWKQKLANKKYFEHVQSYVYGVASRLIACTGISGTLRSVSEMKEPRKKELLISVIDDAKESLKTLTSIQKDISLLPPSMRERVNGLWDLAHRTTLALAQIKTKSVNSEDLERSIKESTAALSELTREQLRSLDLCTGFFHLQHVFNTYGFTTVQTSKKRALEMEELFHTKLLFDHKREGAPLTRNSLSIETGSPTVLLGPNTSGKSKLAEAILLASFFAMHFDVAPAKRFALPTGLRGSIGISDFTRDPDRPTGSGKFLRLQTQTASVVKRAAEGGYIVVLDEPGEGTNGFEGRATIHALAEYLTACGNIVIFPTHLHKAVEHLEATIGVQAFASGLGSDGKYSFGRGKKSSLGMDIALEEGLLPDIVDRAREVKNQLLQQ